MHVAPPPAYRWKLYLLVLLCSVYCVAQVTCPPSSPCDNNSWSSFSRDVAGNSANPCYWRVEGRYRCCNGSLEVIYDNVTIRGNCDFAQKFTYLHYNVESYKEYIDLNILANNYNTWYTSACGGGITEIATCDGSYDAGSGSGTPSTATSLTAKIYSASCGVWLKCTYEIDPSAANRQCETGYDPPYPDYAEGSTFKVDVWKWQSCGTSCCKKTYRVCKAGHDDANYPAWYRGGIKIESVSKERISPCENEPTGSSPKYAKPCQDGC